MNVASAIVALRARVSDDELLWLELRRHEQSHPFLDGYRPDFSSDDDWNTWMSKMLDGEVVKLDEVMRRCASAEAPYAGASGLVVELARRLSGEVTAVRTAVTRMMMGLRTH